MNAYAADLAMKDSSYDDDEMENWLKRWGIKEKSEKEKEPRWWGKDEIEFNPDWAVHPGECLDEYLEMNNFTVWEASAITGISVETLRRILCGMAPVDKEIADALERAFGLSAHIWLGLQEDWDAKNGKKIT